MTARLSHIYRHPIKSHGRQPLGWVTLTAGQTMPWDRHWAVAHATSKFDPAAPQWLACANFSIGSGIPGIMAITAVLDEASATVTLTHPDRVPLTIRPDDPTEALRFLDWVRPLVPADKSPPTRIVRVPGRGMTDTDYPSISISNLASNAAVSAHVGTDLSHLRWRSNLWVDGLQPWVERTWPGRSLRIGAAILSIREPMVRCKATTANPATGIADFDKLLALRQMISEQHFGSYAEVTTGGTIRLGDPVEVLA